MVIPTETTPSDFYVPSAESVEKAVKDYEPIERTYVEEPENLADIDDLVAPYAAAVSGFHSRFQGTASRRDLETFLKNSDAKWRMTSLVSQQYKANSAQKQDTLSHVASEQFYNSVKLMHSGLTSIIFGDGEENPARYDPIKGSKDYTTEEGKRVTEEQTAYWANLYAVDRWAPKLKSSMLWMLKNAQELISVQWMYRTKSQIERIPGYYNRKGQPQEAVIGQPVPREMFDVNKKPIDKVFDEDGHPKSFVFMPKTRVVQNQPIIIRYGMKNCLLDLDITPDSFNDVIQKQTCIISWDDVTFADLEAGEKDGLYKNVSKLTNSHLYDGTDEESDTINTDRDENADVNRDKIQNGLFRRYHVYYLAPIDYDKKTWDVKAIPQVSESVFVGKMTGIGNATGEGDKSASETVCLMLRQLPYHHGRFPFKLINSI